MKQKADFTWQARTSSLNRNHVVEDCHEVAILEVVIPLFILHSFLSSAMEINLDQRAPSVLRNSS
jgi:hypothetical protein